MKKNGWPFNANAGCFICGGAVIIASMAANNVTISIAGLALCLMGAATQICDVIVNEH